MDNVREKLPHPDSDVEQGTDISRSVTTEDNAEGHERSMKPVVTALDWTGPEDPENPENWSFWKKTYHVAYVGLQCFVITLSSSIYTPSTVAVAEHFGVSLEAATVPLTVYVLGLALGPAIAAPLSETHGRRIVYLTLFPISLLFTLGAGLSKSFASLVVCRFFAGTIGSGALAIGAGTNSDINTPTKRAAVSSIFLLAPFAGPAFGPPIGGYVVQYEDWRWPHYCILMAGLFVLVFGLFQKETYKKIILQNRAKRLGLPRAPSPLDGMSAVSKMKFMLTITVTRPLVMLFTEPIVAFLGAYTAFTFGVLFIFFTAFPLIFQSPYPQIQIYHFELGESGLVFISIFIGLLLGCGIFLIIDTFWYKPRARLEIAKGKSERVLLLPPESRTHSALVGSFFLPISLFWFAWTAKADVHWAVPVAACIFFGAGNLLVFFTAVMYSIDCMGPMNGASAMAANGIARYVCGAVFPLFARQMYLAMGVGWAMSLLGFVTVALMPVPWVLWYYGPKIRSRSAYVPKDLL